MSDYTDHDIDAANDRADMRREFYRPRLRPHWCTECLGHDGPGSPCYVEPAADEDSTGSDE